MHKIAVTGGIATGKSYVVKRLREAGVPVVDADVLARQAVAPHSDGLTAVVARFGPGILTSMGELDRATLGDIVFRDQAARHDLEAIVHPIVRRDMAEFFARLPPETPLAMADIPLLYETSRAREFDAVIVVACEPATQVDRIMARDGLSREAAERRVAAQLPIEEKVRRADHVIRTDRSHAETDVQVAEVLRSLRSQ